LNDIEQLQADIKELEAETEAVIGAYITVAGVSAVKSLLAMIDRQALAAAEQREGLTRASGVVKAARQFLDK
jgi:hypothetical protein